MINIDDIIDRIKRLKGIETVQKVAELLGISSPDLYGRKKRGTLKKLMVDWAINNNVNTNWLLTGEGDPHIKKGVVLDEDPGVAGLLDMTRAVLKSGNQRASEALKRNIEYFFQAIKDQRSLRNTQSELVETKKRISNIESALSAIKEDQKEWRSLIKKGEPGKSPAGAESSIEKKET